MAAQERLLVDELKTSDQYLAERAAEAELFHLHFAQKKSLQERVGLAASMALDRFVLTLSLIHISICSSAAPCRAKPWAPCMRCWASWPRPWAWSG